MGKWALHGVEWDEELKVAAFGHILTDPIAHHEFLYPDPSPSRADRRSIKNYTYDPKNHLELTPGQYPFVLANTIVIASGRGVGKTEIGEWQDSVRRALAYPQGQISLVYNNGTLIDNRLFDPIVNIVQNHCILKHLVNQSPGRGVKKEDRLIDFKNGSSIQCHYPGGSLSKSGGKSPRLEGPRSTHSTFEEAQQLLEEHIQQAIQQQLVDPFNVEDQRSRGAGLRFIGVPNGDKMTPLYFYDNSSTTQFTRPLVVPPSSGRAMERIPINFRWKLPSTAMPYITTEKHASLLTNYRCDPERGIYTEEYKQKVWGLHGCEGEQPFSQRLREPISKPSQDWRSLKIARSEFQQHARRGGDGKVTGVDFGFMSNLIPSRALGVYGLGIDIGTTESTIIEGFVKDERHNIPWRWQWVIDLNDWSDPWEQCLIMDFLCNVFDPEFIGLDVNGPGIGFYSILVNQSSSFDYKSRIVQYKGQSFVTIGYGPDHDALKRSRNALEMQIAGQRSVPLRARAAEWSMGQIMDMFLREEILLPSFNEAPEVHDQFDRITRKYIRRQSGTPGWTYTPLHQHYVSALQTFIVAEREWSLMKNDRPVHVDGEDSLSAIGVLSGPAMLG